MARHERADPADPLRRPIGFGVFPDDHPIESLRGIRRPKAGAALRAFAQRAAYLEKRLGHLPPSDNARGYIYAELAAIAVAVDLIRAVRQRTHDDHDARDARDAHDDTSIHDASLKEEGAP